MKKNTYNDELKRGIIIFSSVVILFAIIYISISIFNGEIKFNTPKKEEKSAEIQYTEILSGQLFNMKHQKYYVLVYDFSEKGNTIYSSITSKYATVKDSLNVYTLDSSNIFNTNIISKDNNLNEYTSELSKLKISSPSLIQINNKKVSKVVKDRDNIIKYFNDLIK